MWVMRHTIQSPPANPVHLLETSPFSIESKSSTEAYDIEQEDREYTMMDPKKVMWTSTTYEQEESDESDSEEHEEEEEENIAYDTRI